MPTVRHRPAVRHQPGVDLDATTPTHGDNPPVAVTVAFVARYLATLHQPSKRLCCPPTTGPAPCVVQTGLDAFRCVDTVQTYFGGANVHRVAVDHPGPTREARPGSLRDRRKLCDSSGRCDRRHGIGGACMPRRELRIQERGGETEARAQDPQHPSQGYLPPGRNVRFPATDRPLQTLTINHSTRAPGRAELRGGSASPRRTELGPRSKTMPPTRARWSRSSVGTCADHVCAHSSVRLLRRYHQVAGRQGRT